jgi:hypothetical protein
MQQIDDESNEKVNYFELLSAEDQSAYLELRAELSSPDNRYNRNKRIDTFIEMLEQIKKFCKRGDNDDWKRYLVCGICWINEDIAINTRQLRILLGKSKSTINGVFSKMNYETLPVKNHETGLQDRIPFLRGNFSESRQWTVRRRASLCVSDCPPGDVHITSPNENEKRQNKFSVKPNQKEVEIEFPSQDYTMPYSDDQYEFNYQYFDDCVDSDFDEIPYEYSTTFGYSQ